MIEMNKNHDSELKVIIEKFGPIQNCEFTIKPLTIFFGSNNTGKTYAGYLLWWVYNANRSGDYSFFKSRSIRRVVKSLQKETLSTIKVLLNSISKHDNTQIQKQNIEKTFTLRDFNKLKISSKVATEIFNSKSVHAQDIVIQSSNSIREITVNMHIIAPNADVKSAMTADFVFRGLFKAFFEPGTTKKDENTRFVVESIGISNLGIGVRYTGRSTLDGRLFVDVTMFINTSRVSTYEEKDIKEELKGILERIVLDPLIFHFTLGKTSIFIPASKSGLALVRKEMYAKSIDLMFSLSANETRRKKLKLPKPMIQYLQLLALLDPENQTNIYTEIVQFLEKNLIRGRIQIEGKTDEILYMPESLNQPLPLHISSSLVVEAMPLITFLKYGVIDENSIVIIEEPEAHLHPDAQRILTKAIVKLINQGVYVVLITHSPYIIQQLNNHIKVHYLQEHKGQKAREFMKRHGWTKNDLLDPSKVAAYLFVEHNGDTRIHKLELDPLSGVPYDAFYSTLKELHDETVDIDEMLYDE